MLPQLVAYRRRALLLALALGLLIALALIVLGRTAPASAQGRADVTISKMANPIDVVVGHEVTYTVTFTNSGSVAYSAVVSDIIPWGTTYVVGSVSPPPPDADFHTGPDRVEWSGPLLPGQTVVLSFRVLVRQPTTAGPLPIRNRACVRYTAGLFSFRRCSSVVEVYSTRPLIYLPLVMRNAAYTPPWPWVQPGSRR